ncbi:MAG TPA: NAD-dependent epimerase/dehydratase family protein [Steroidobacteraceae bacterium]|jgi:nucleoside-diphosphate-sugar epimerase|nr:NAD-dependent epimerase/dehydratase family protein [Steroidobacteraceae bacterium]
MNGVNGIVAVTGANGFVGQHLLAALLAHEHPVRALVRHEWGPRPVDPRLEVRRVGEFRQACWPELLRGADALVHLAAVAHRGAPRDAPTAAAVRAINVEAVAAIARGAVAAGVRRMIYLSSIGVLGATGTFDGSSPPAPHDFYSRTKLAGEQAAEREAGGSPLQLCVVRAPLVFGPHAPGNFARLVNYVQRGIPLPLGAVRNRRSLLSAWNLADLLIRCLRHPGAPGAPLLAADEESVSTPELIRLCAEGLHRRARLVSVPVRALQLACAALGRSADFDRLCGSLVIDTSVAWSRLQWRPSLDVREGLRRAAAAAIYAGERRG